MNHLGGMVADGGVEWLPRATYLESMYWTLGVHLWLATQELRDYHVFCV
jgi:hypothetical protein